MKEIKKIFSHLVRGFITYGIPTLLLLWIQSKFFSSKPEKDKPSIHKESFLETAPNGEGEYWRELREKEDYYDYEE